MKGSLFQCAKPSLGYFVVCVVGCVGDRWQGFGRLEFHLRLPNCSSNQVPRRASLTEPDWANLLSGFIVLTSQRFCRSQRSSEVESLVVSESLIVQSRHTDSAGHGELLLWLRGSSCVGRLSSHPRSRTEGRGARGGRMEGLPGTRSVGPVRVQHRAEGRVLDLEDGQLKVELA